MLPATLRFWGPVLAGVLLTGSGWAQATPADSAKSSSTPPQAAFPVQHSWALLLVDSRIILGNTVALNPDDIAAIEVIRDAVPGRWQSIAGDGVISLRLRRGVRVPARSLPSLRRQLGVRGPVRYELDGQPLHGETLRIATRAIGQLAVRPPGPGEAATTIAICLKPYVPQPKNDPPGTSYLRGRAAGSGP